MGFVSLTLYCQEYKVFVKQLKERFGNDPKVTQQKPELEFESLCLKATTTTTGITQADKAKGSCWRGPQGWGSWPSSREGGSGNASSTGQRPCGFLCLGVDFTQRLSGRCLQVPCFLLEHLWKKQNHGL